MSKLPTFIEGWNASWDFIFSAIGTVLPFFIAFVILVIVMAIFTPSPYSGDES